MLVGALVGVVGGWRLLWKVDPVAGALDGALVGVGGGAVDPMEAELWYVSVRVSTVAQWRCNRWMQWRCGWVYCLFVFMWLL